MPKKKRNRKQKHRGPTAPREATNHSRSDTDPAAAEFFRGATFPEVAFLFQADGDDGALPPVLTVAVPNNVLEHDEAFRQLRHAYGAAGSLDRWVPTLQGRAGWNTYAPISGDAEQDRQHALAKVVIDLDAPVKVHGAFLFHLAQTGQTVRRVVSRDALFGLCTLDQFAYIQANSPSYTDVLETLSVVLPLAPAPQLALVLDQIGIR